MGYGGGVGGGNDNSAFMLFFIVVNDSREITIRFALLIAIPPYIRILSRPP